nr:uncharacterized protein LOC110588435 [Neomonachus schauinslandi]XP_045735503.1 uncharacterized protein LOC123847781 [Mirounga angustirostris]
MAERKQSGKPAEDEEVPAFFKNLGSGSPKPRQKFCGMFCPVEGSSENKTIDFDSLSVGRGSGQVVAQQRDVAHLGPDPQPPYSRQGRRAGGEPSVESSRKVEIRRASGKEALQNIYDQLWLSAPPFFDASRSVQWRVRMQARRLPGVREGRGLRQQLPAAPCALSHDTFSLALRARVRSSEARTMVSASADRLGGSPRPTPVRRVKRGRLWSHPRNPRRSK